MRQLEKLNSNRQKANLTKYLSNNDIHNKYLNDSITINEIKNAIRQQKNNKAVGIDNIPAEIFKANIDWWANELHACFKLLWNKTHPKGWQCGIIIFFFKKGDKRNINNYRPITLLPTIYKIWCTILSNRLTPILNLLTNEQQCAYKTNKSTMDIIYLIKNKYIKGEIKGQILLDLSKAFDRINRSKLWYILYEYGLPENLLYAIVNSHQNTQLSARHQNNRGPLIPNNIGVFQGNPLSPQLFIIYAAHAMNNYNANLNSDLINLYPLVTRSENTEHNWSNFVLKLKTKNINDELPVWKNDPSATKEK